MKKIFLLVLLVIVVSLNNYAQFNQAWLGKKCAVVLTYDDAISQHLDNSITLIY
jgi:hypothetical protein